MFGSYGLSSISGLFGDYASIRSGTYAKLMRSVYSNQNSTVGRTNTSRANANNWLNQKNQIQDSSEQLVSDASKLTNTGKNSLFAKGAYTEKDVDAIYQSVKSFASDYNKMVDASKTSSNSSVSGMASNLATTTKIVKGSLNDVGIDVDSEGKLSVNEKVFKNSDMRQVKRLFNGSSSYGGSVLSSASRINRMSAQSSSIGNGYGYYNSLGSLMGSSGRSSYGNYSNYYSLFNRYF